MVLTAAAPHGYLLPCLYWAIVTEWCRDVPVVYLVSYLRCCRVQPADQRGPLHALRGQQSQELPLAAQLQRRGGAHTLQLGLVPQAVQRWVHI